MQASTSHRRSAATRPPRPPAPPPTTFEPLTAHDRLRRMHALNSFYQSAHRMPAKPKSRHDLDVLKERHQFVRDSRVDPATLSWEDQLATKFYDSLFKEYAVVNLKHYKSGTVALRWRTEDEVLSGIGHLTCGSLRCRFHEPSPNLLAALEAGEEEEEEVPLVEAKLEELQVPFGYVEDGEKKSVLVKVVLCRDCAKKLRHGRHRAKERRTEEEQQQQQRAAPRRRVSAGAGATDPVPDATSAARSSSSSTGRPAAGPASPRLEQRSYAPRDAQRRTHSHDNNDNEEEPNSDPDRDDYRPDLPRDLMAGPAVATPAERSRRRRREEEQEEKRTVYGDGGSGGSERRRSASPRRHRR